MQQAEETAAEAEAKRGGCFHFERERRIVEAQLAHGGTQVLEISGVDRKQSAEHDRLRGLEARQHLVRRAAIFGDRIANARIGHFLDGRGDEAKLAGAEFVHLNHLRREDAGAFHRIFRAGSHHADGLALFQHAINDAHQNDDAEIAVIPAVDQHGLERRIAVAFLWCGQLGDNGFQHVLDAEAGLGGNMHGLRSIDADHFLNLLFDALRLSSGQIDLVQHNHDFMVVVDGLIDIGQRLRFHALRGVHHKKRTFARGQRARDFIGEVDVSGRIDQVQHIIFAVLRLVGKTDGLRLDGDAALALDVHRVEDLILHLARVQPAGQLDEAVGQRRLAVVDMGDDRKIANMVKWCAHARDLTASSRISKLYCALITGKNPAIMIVTTSPLCLVAKRR